MVALGIPLILTILTLVDIAVGKHTSKHESVPLQLDELFDLLRIESISSDGTARAPSCARRPTGWRRWSAAAPSSRATATRWSTR